MSRQNKVNKSNYDQGGRLTPDEMASERAKQQVVTGRAANQKQVNGKPHQPPAGPASSPRRTEREEEE